MRRIPQEIIMKIAEFYGHKTLEEEFYSTGCETSGFRV